MLITKCILFGYNATHLLGRKLHDFYQLFKTITLLKQNKYNYLIIKIIISSKFDGFYKKT